MRKVNRSVFGIMMMITMSYSASTLKDLAEKYPMTITAEAKKDFAEIRISGALYEWNNSTETMTAKVDEFLAKGLKDVKVYINSPGGDVFVAAEIINQLNRFTGKKEGFGGALIASAATLIAMELDTFEMAENGQWMYHKPSGWISGNEDKVESQLVLLKNLSAQYRKKYADKTGINEDVIEANWAKGDVWLTAKQALEQKFITAIKGKERVSQQTAEMISACGGTPPIVNFNNHLNKMENRNQILAILKLPADATDQQIEAAIKASTEKAAQVEALTAQATNARNVEINALVDSAIAQKKITADVKDNYVALAQKDFEGTKAVIEALTPIQKPDIDTGASADGREKWTMEDWQEKDPEGLTEMMVKNPTAFAIIEKNYFGK